MNKICWLGLTLFLILSLSNAQLAEFCWKDTYGRGVGTIPGSCDSDEDKIGLLCYDKCFWNEKIRIRLPLCLP